MTLMSKDIRVIMACIIPIEVWKALGEEAIELLTDVFTLALSSGRMPDEWRDSLLTPICKKKGDVLECKSYCGIKLLSHTFKLYERIIDSRLREIIRPNEAHFGFMPGKRTTDAIFTMRQVIEKYREGQENLDIVFIDLEKAYDRVPREEIWRCLRLRGVPEVLVRTVKDMYHECTTKIRTAAGETESFMVKVGLHQGSALSPFLFVSLMDLLTEDLELEIPWTVLYADDVMLCMAVSHELNIKLEDWRERLEERGLRINRIKTECMRCTFGDEEENNIDLEIDLERIKEVPAFRYLKVYGLE